MKLGYGGTKEEMERLIEDANRLKEAQGEAADLTIDSYADVIEAIHLVQDEMGITGATAKEAEGTISGSINMTKAAWENLMIGLADSNADIPQLVSNVMSSAGKVLDNVIPVVKEILRNIPVAISEISPEAGAAVQKVMDICIKGFDVLKKAIKPTVEIIGNIFGFLQDHTGLLTTIAAVVGTIATAIGLYNAVSAIQSGIQAAKVALNLSETATLWSLVAAQTAALAPYLLIVAAIAAVIAIGVLLVKNWDEIKAKVIEIAGKVKEKFEEIKNAVTEKIEAAKAAVKEKFDAIKNTMGNVMEAAKKTVSDKLNNIKNAYNEHGGGIKGIAAAAMEGIKGYYSAGFSFIDNLTGGKLSSVVNTVKSKMNSVRDFFKSALDKIKGFFSGLKLEFPKIKLPHFKISGKFSLDPPSMPKVSVSWYKKAMDNAMLLNSPTIFGYDSASGKFLGGGEAGSEVVAGSSTLMNMIQTAVATQNADLIYYVQKIIEILADYFPQMIDSLSGMGIVLDDGTLVGRLAPAMDVELGRIKARKDRGR